MTNKIVDLFQTILLLKFLIKVSILEADGLQ
jgi:hypothetical protein